MRRVEAEALVGASRDEVWRLYDDIAGTPGWVPGVRELVYVSGPARMGTVYRQRTRVATAQWEIVEYRRPTRQVHQSLEGSVERTRATGLSQSPRSGTAPGGRPMSTPEPSLKAIATVGPGRSRCRRTVVSAR